MENKNRKSNILFIMMRIHIIGDYLGSGVIEKNLIGNTI